MRRLEGNGGTYEDFAAKCLQAVRSYPAPEALVPSMRARMQKLVALQGGVITNAPLPR